MMNQETADAILEEIRLTSHVEDRHIVIYHMKLFLNSLVSNPQWEESEMRRCRCGEPMSYSRTLLMELEQYHWTCMDCGWTQIESNSLVVEDELPSVNFRDGKPYNYCPTCGREEPPEATDEDISLRMYKEWVSWLHKTDKDGEHSNNRSFPDWLKEMGK